MLEQSVPLREGAVTRVAQKKPTTVDIYTNNWRILRCVTREYLEDATWHVMSEAVINSVWPLASMNLKYILDYTLQFKP
jgi:transposase-like protein